MSARIPPGFAEAWMSFGLVDDPELMYCSIGIDLASGVGALQSVADAILTEFRGIRNQCTSAYAVGPGHVIFGNDGGDIRIDGTISAALGTSGSASCPQNVAMLVKKLTGAGGRRGRGRMYVPGIAEGDVTDNGSITSTSLSTRNTNIDSLRANLIGLADVENVVLLHESAPFTPTVITDLDVDNRVATQRRRLRR